MRDVRIAQLAGRQFNRISRRQLRELGLTATAIEHRLSAGRLVAVEEGVFAVAPVREDDDWGKWAGATLTAPATVLSHHSAAAAWGVWSRERVCESVTRPGNGGPRRFGGVIVHRSTTLAGSCTSLRGVPITTVPRTLCDLAGATGRSAISDRAVARLVRESVRLRLVTLPRLGDALGAYPGRRGSRRLACAIARYSGLPLERARSGAEVKAIEVLRAAGRTLPRLNRVIAREEADLSWASERLIIEIDGSPFHLDAGEDARREAVWSRAGWTVLRISSDTVYEAPERLLALAPSRPSPRTAVSTPHRRH